MNVLVPSLYLFPLVFAYLGPKNFGFGYDGLVYAGLAVGALGMVLWILSILTLGLFLACGSKICLVYVFVVVVPLNVFRARAEEVVLQEQLGEAYQQYRASTFF